MAESSFHFQRLIVYQNAKEHYRKIVNLSKGSEIPHYIKDQWLRASLSVVLNIAEGSGRTGHKEKIRFYNIARSSVFECVALADILASTEKIQDALAADLFKASDELSRMLYTMTRKRINQLQDSIMNKHAKTCH